MAESVARQRINWRVLGVEAAAIFFSVLLGFAVTEWREARRNARTVESALAAYADEIATNQRSVAQAYQYHTGLLGALQSRAATVAPGTSLLDVLGRSGWQGPRQIVFQTAAREAATATNVLGLVPFDDASILVSLYNRQDGLDAVEQGFGTAILNPAILDEDNGREAVLSTSAYLSMVTEAEANLLRLYRLAIDDLDIDEPVAADTLLPDG